MSANSNANTRTRPGTDADVRTDAEVTTIAKTSPASSAESTFDVAIVGYGPVGALAALLLADAGLRVVILERSKDPVILPRAVGIDGESMRTFQRLGHAQAVSAIVQPPRERDELAFTNSRREPYFGVALPRFGPNGWREVAFFDQPELEALLRELVEEEDRIRVELGCEVCRLQQDETGVSLEVQETEPAMLSTFRAAYAIGCDGASSFVRGELGIEWQSLDYDQDWLVLDITQGPGAELPLTTMQVCDPERLVSYICVKDPNRRWEFQLLEGEAREEMLRPERIEALLEPWIAPEHFTIRRAAVYQFHAATAASWRQGRVLLAGDAAHQTPPFLGQGLNAGFRDAANLGWKLPLVISGVCKPELLDTYAEERDAHARDLVEWAVDIGKLMENLAAGEAGRPAPHAAGEQRSGYGQGRTVPPLRAGAFVDAQLGAAGLAGSLLRQPRVKDSDGGAPYLLDDRFGPGFAVVARRAEDLVMRPEAAKILDRFGARCVALDDVDVVEGELDRLLQEHPALVLRPDRHVFGVVDEDWSLDQLISRLGRKLSLVQRPG